MAQNMHLQDSFDTHAASSSASAGLRFMHQPSSVLEMALHNGLLFVLLQCGLCPVYLVAGQQHPCIRTTFLRSSSELRQ